jgi:hypothetical protein
VLETIRREFWSYAENVGLTASLHRDFHHLTSSQAMAFNLFFPFFGMRGDYSAPLLVALGSVGGEVQRWEFEAIPDAAEGTSVDSLIEFVGGRRLLIEVKLTESNFSSCRADERHRFKLQQVYAPRLHGKVAEGALAEDAFYAHYQLFRNVSHLNLEAGDYLVLIVPRANAGPWNTAGSFRQRFLNDVSRQAVRLVAFEELLQGLPAKVSPIDSPVLRAHLAFLAEKYLPLPAVLTH